MAILLSKFTSPVHPTTSGRLFREEDINNGCNETHNAIAYFLDQFFLV